ncbi:MAG TPA: hypothetical protein VLF89_07110 [Candidatus Saccharimonadales bacterium]|nr:hypothetical protein [Candidatus Saccharimonadales bacterium]
MSHERSQLNYLSSENKPLVNDERTNKELLFPSNSLFETDFYKSLESSPFKDRILAALDKPPIYGILWKDDHWSTEYTQLLTSVVEKCKCEGVCDHGFRHRIHVIENMFVVTEMLNQGIYREGRSILPPGAFSTAYSDADIVALALWHDLEYGLEEFDWDGKYKNDHQTREKTTMGDFLVEYVSNLSQRIPAEDERTQKSLKRLQELLPVYRKAVDISSKQAFEEMDSLLETNCLTSETVLPYGFKFADVVHYYEANRLAELAVPEDDSNIYFFLCYMIETYGISYDNLLIRHELKFKKNFKIPTKSGLREMSVDDWMRETGQGYNTKLEHKFAQLTSRELIRKGMS